MRNFQICNKLSTKLLNQKNKRFKKINKIKVSINFLIFKNKDKSKVKMNKIMIKTKNCNPFQIKTTVFNWDKSSMIKYRMKNKKTNPK